MPVSEEYRNYILERLECVGEVTARKMFGGLGLYLDGVFFALAADNILYFKVDDINLPDYEARGTGPFKPFGENSYSMSYYEVPAEILEDDEALAIWANKAYDAALRSKSRRSGTKRRKPG